MRGCESMSHNTRMCKATGSRVQIRFKRNDVGSLYVIMNRKKCLCDTYHRKMEKTESKFKTH